MADRFICLAIGYAFGCALTADVVCRHVVGRSAFDVGIGNPGMANVAHELGVRWGLVTLAGDIAKTLLAMAVSLVLFPELGNEAFLFAGVGATIGHCFPAWHAFKGGKGVTTTCVTLIMAWPVAGLVSCAVGLGVVLGLRYLCLGAIVIPVAFLLVTLFAGTPVQSAAAVVLVAIALLEHLPAARGIRDGSTPTTDLMGRLRHR